MRSRSGSGSGSAGLGGPTVFFNVAGTTIARRTVHGSPRAYGLLRRCAVLPGRGVIVAGEHRRGRLEDILGELPLAGQQLPGEVVGARDELLRLGQLLGK